jgi:hypothetical protein
MAAKPKLTPEQWADVRKHWENDSRDGYSWLVEELSLPVSAPAVRKVAIRDGWSKGASKAESKPKAAAAKAAKARQPSKPTQSSKVSKVSQGNHAKVSETIESETFDEEAIAGEEPERRSVGRPTLFRDEYVEQAYKLCLLGATDAELADFFEVCERTINTWKEDYPEFLQSLKAGKASADAAVAESLYKRALGYSHPDVHISNFQGMITVTDIVKHYPPDTGAAFIWLKNRQPHKWKDKVEVKEDINLNIFPPKEVLKELFEASLKRSTEKAAMLTNRRERLGIVIEAGQDVD